MNKYEFEQQCKVISWCKDNVGRCSALVAIVGSANGEVRPTKVNSKGQKYCPSGERLKRSGVQKGFPDLQLPIPMLIEGVLYSALEIEMKEIDFNRFSKKTNLPLAVKYGVTSPEQTKVQNNLKAFGHFVITCYSADTLDKQHGEQRIQHIGAIDAICEYLGIDRGMIEAGKRYHNWHKDWCKKMGLKKMPELQLHDKDFNDDLPSFL